MPISPADRAAIRSQFEALQSPVKLDYFHQSPKRVVIPGRVEKPSAAFALEVYREIAGLGDLVSLIVHEYEDEPGEAAKRGARDVPCVVVRGELNRPVRLYGAPNGHLLVALVRAMVLASARPKALAAITRALKRLRGGVRIELFASPAQPQSGEAALVAWATAMLSPKLEADVYAVEEFPAEARRAGIEAVPSTILIPAGGAPAAPIAGVIDGQDLAEYAALLQARPERARLNPPRGREQSAAAYRPPPAAPQRAPSPAAPGAAAAAQAGEPAATPAGMHRTQSGLIVPDR